MPPEPLYVTRPSLPPRHELDLLLDGIWDRRILTNGGPLHQRLESELASFLGIEHLSLFANATIALVTALQAMKIQGEVITTPFSFVATSHSLLWNNLTPVFCDIDPVTLNLDPNRLESLITSKTSAIMPVHCYGHPCDTDAIGRIAGNHGLKVLYDAAHAFAIADSGGSVLRHGDLSVLSFHATKVFNTFEGGAIACANAGLKARIDKLKNFGFEDEVTVTESGINGKMSELHAAIGLCQLRRIDGDIQRRAEIAAIYRRHLAMLPGIRVVSKTSEVRENHSYFPILIGPEFPLARDEVYGELRREGIFARRYFYPLISDFPMYRGLPSADPSGLPTAQRIARSVLCLPMASDMMPEEAERVCRAITQCMRLART
jgi:dTDP-4-amino-4,6-dideoxygalactose transaminase